MDELKTLKDINWMTHALDKEFKYKMIYLSDLKAEAAKWVKDCSPAMGYEERLKYGCDVCKWIVNFFNLSEEDLKDE